MRPFPLPYVITVSDGAAIRSVHPERLGPHRAAVDAALTAILMPGPEFVSAPGRRPATEAMLTQREIATGQGYTGDCCQTCGEFRMKRSGTCLTCEGCGSTSGGCS